MTRVRLLKVVVQPVFVVDDGDALSEHPQLPQEVAARDWAAYPDELERRRREAEESLTKPSG